MGTGDGYDVNDEALRRGGLTYGELGDTVGEIRTTSANGFGDHDCLGGDDYSTVFLGGGHQHLLDRLDEHLAGHTGALHEHRDRRLKMAANYRLAEEASGDAVGRADPTDDTARA